MAETYFFFAEPYLDIDFDHKDGGWLIAVKRDGYEDHQYGAYALTGPFQKYNDALDAWQTGAVNG